MGRWEYPTSRRILMQLVLWIIFGASVGLAALVTHDRQTRNGNRLADVRYVGRIGVKLPTGWILQRENQGNVLLVASEPDTADQKGRQITIRRHKVDPTVSPEQFLESSGLLTGTLRLVSTDPAANIAEPITIANQPGVMLSVKKPLGSPSAPDSDYETELFAVSVRPSGLGISLELDCPGDSDPEADRQTLIDIAQSMDVQDFGHSDTP
jgi:hypothetical protein